MFIEQDVILMDNKYNYDDAPELVRKFLNYKLAIQNRSKLTVFNYYHDLRTFSRYLLLKKNPDKYSEIPFDSIAFSDADDELLKSASVEDIFAFLSFAAKELENTASSRSRKLSCLRSFYKYLTKTIMVIDVNPTEKVESPKKNKTLPKHLTLDESKQLLESVDGKNAERDFAIITLFLNCGMRVSELAGIDLGDLSNDLSSVTVTGKGSKQRRLFLNDACQNAIRAYLKIRPTDIKNGDRNALFVSRNKNRISVKTVQWLIYKHLKAAGLGNLNMSVHKLRHTAATLMYAYGGTDVRVLKDILGHEELSTTQIYTHIKDDQMIEAAYANPLAKGVKRKPKNNTENGGD